MDNFLSYEESVDKLNKLPSNAKTIKECIGTVLKQKEIKRDSILRYLEYTGYNTDDLSKLSVIHIAGTKGKGSTSALCESILRHHGFKTGFFSSPHLLSVTERIKLNGLSIQRDYFAKIFDQIYNQLQDNQQYDGDMPPYFGFLTVMALNIFIREKVDVAIVEVGIGGEFDQTNVVKNVPIVGITSLGYDHTALLGNTIGEIARQKAGIMKPGCKAFTVQQPPGAMKILEEMAEIRKCSLNVVTNLEKYNWENIINDKDIHFDNPTTYLNASLAIQLSHNWMSYRKVYDHMKINNSEFIVDSYRKNNLIMNDIPLETFKGIKTCFWPGRCQFLRRNGINYYIDGAHTEESMYVCTEWFKSQCRNSSYKFLIFHVTSDRNPIPLMKLLAKCNFDVVLFSPNVAFAENKLKNSIDQISSRDMKNQQISKCIENAEIWKNKIVEIEGNVVKPKTEVFSSISLTFDYIASHCKAENVQNPQVLITGSLHLVGAALTVLNVSVP